MSVICLSSYTSVCLSAFLTYVILSTSQSLPGYLRGFMPAFVPVCLFFFCLCNRPYDCFPDCLSVLPSVRLSVFPSVRQLVFLKRALFSIVSSHFGLQKVYLDRDITLKKSLKFWNLATWLDRHFQMKWKCTRHVMTEWTCVHKDFYHGSYLGNR